ncbi:MAG: methyl-accepting chemotaxis protein [Rhodoferax sp.]|nr:methyl-accepting chemotaxis protein [Rhodoferax sp.]
MKLKQFTLVAFGVQILLMLAAGLYGIYSLSRVLDLYERDVRQSFQTERAVHALAAKYHDQMLQWKVTLLKAKSQETLDTHREAFDRQQAEVLAQAKTLAQASGGEVRGAIEQFIAAHEELGKAYMKAMWDFNASGFDNAVADAAMADQDTVPKRHLDKAVELQRNEEGRVSELATTTARRAELLSVLVMVGFGVLGLLATQYVSSRIVRSVGGDPTLAVAIAKSVAHGDFSNVHSARTPHADSIIGHLAMMQQNLARLVAEVRASASNVKLESEHIARANEDLAAGSDQQTYFVRDATSTVHKMAEIVTTNQSSAEHARNLVSQTTELANVSGQTVADVVNAMQEISASSKRISEIIAVIDSIAFQTNILALNAAVESARAGEHGKGFAVVSAEVRSLANRTTEAASEIKTLIHNSLGTVERGAQLADRAGHNVVNMVDAIRQANEAIQAISQASHMQAAALTDIETAMSNVENTTQRNSGLVEGVLHSTANLHAKSSDMLMSVNAFKLSGEAAHQQTAALKLEAAQ